VRPSDRIGLSVGLACLLVWLSGCFTEVGNAEDERLSAEFKIDYSNNPQPLPKAAAKIVDSDSIRILLFYLLIKEAVYHVQDSVGAPLVTKFLWREGTTSVAVDFTGADKTAVLATETLDKNVPVNLTVECEFPYRGQLFPDTLDFDGFNDQSYIKGTYGVGASAIDFLFAFPQSKEIHLTYSQTALRSWYQDRVYHCQFTFFANKWVAGIDISKADLVKDKLGRSIAVFDATHNLETYQMLVTSFYKSFNATQVAVEGH